MQDSDFTLLSLGGLHLSSELELSSQLKGKVSKDTPILTCPMDASVLDVLQRQKSGGSFGYGSIPVDDIRLLTIRLQLGGVQIYWLADATDADVWRAMDKWAKVGFAPHVFLTDAGRKERTAAFGRSDVDPKAPIIGQYRSLQRASAPPEMWEMMTALAASGIIQLQATSDVRGIPLEVVLVNVLVTKRYTHHVEGKVFSQKPIVAPSHGPASSIMH